MRSKIILILICFLVLVGFSYSTEVDEKIEKLPIFDLEIPKMTDDLKLVEQNVLTKKSKEDSLEKYIVHLKNPEKIWPKQVSDMQNDDIVNLKQVMREYTIDKTNRKNIKHKYNFFNGFSAKLTNEEYQQLLDNPLVDFIEKDLEVEIFMQDTVELINATNVWDYQIDGINLTGTGETVCVIDTGVDYTHQDLGGCEKIYSNTSTEIVLDTPITSPNYPENYSNNFNFEIRGEYVFLNADSIVVYFDDFETEQASDFVYLFDKNDNLIWWYSGNLGSFWSVEIPGDTVKIGFESDSTINYKGFNITKVRGYNFTSECDKVIGGHDFAYGTNNPIDYESHGTHVAGTVAANGNLKGVSPDSKIVAVKSMNDLGGGITSDIIAGIEYCVENYKKYNISVISMSLGGDSFSNYCDSNFPSYQIAINNAIKKNISVVVATGNEGFLNNIASPACIYNATRVGSSNKTDNEISYFSNRWNLEMLVAPGSQINSTIPLDSYDSYSGTSMATPHVVGAFAIVNQYLKLNNITKTPKEIEQLFFDNRKIIFDEDSNRDYSRIDINSVILALDDVFPNIIVNSPKNKTYTNKTILLNISADDNIAMDKIWYNFNEANITYNESININFTEGQNKLYAFVNDSAGNINSTNVSFFIDTIFPNVIINGPENKTYRNKTILLNISGEDNIAIDKIWYNFNGTNITYNESLNINFTEGQNKLYAFVNDSAGNINSTNVSFFIDTILPYIAIYSPENKIYNKNLTDLNVSSNKIINNWFYSLNDNENISFIPNTTIAGIDGLNSLKVYANDTIGNINYTVINFTIDTIIPNITINSPENKIYTNQTILLNISGEDNLEIDKIWYNYNGTNITYNKTINITLNDQEYFLKAWTNDSAGNVNSTNLTFVVDITPPYFTNLKTHFPYLYNETNNYWFNITIKDLTYVDLVRLYIKNTSDSEFNYYDMTNTSDLWFYNITNLSFGNYSYYFWANDSLNNSKNLTNILNFRVVDSLKENETKLNSTKYNVLENKTKLIVDSMNLLKNISIKSNINSRVNLNLFNTVKNNSVLFNNNITINRNLSNNNLILKIFENTTMSVNNSLWDGEFILPEVLTDINVASSTVNFAIRLGLENFDINFDKPIKIILPGQSDKKVGYKKANKDLVEITTVCNSTKNPTNIFSDINPKLCKINKDTDLIVYTYHLTDFVSYTPIVSDDGGSNGGGSGGGGSGSSRISGGSFSVNPTDRLSYKITFLSIKENEKKLFNISKINFPINYINFNALKDIERVTFEIFKISNLSKELKNINDSKFINYSFIHLTNEGIITEDVENIIINFKINKTWLVNNNLSTKNISLLRYNDNWTKQLTFFEKEDKDFSYFNSHVDGFSYYAIVGKLNFKKNNTNKSFDNSSTKIIINDSINEEINESLNIIVDENLSYSDSKTFKEKKDHHDIYLFILISLILFVFIINFILFKNNFKNKKDNLENDKNFKKNKVLKNLDIDLDMDYTDNLNNNDKKNKKHIKKNKKSHKKNH